MWSGCLPGTYRQLCWHDAEAELAAPEEIERGVIEVTQRIGRALDGGRRVWILTHGQIEGARWEVDRQFFQRIRSMRIDVRPVNDELGLAELVADSSDFEE